MSSFWDGRTWFVKQAAVDLARILRAPPPDDKQLAEITDILKDWYRAGYKECQRDMKIALGLVDD